MNKQKIRKLILGIILTAVIIVAAIGALGLNWYHNLPKFHDLTVELGTEIIELSEFTTKYADTDKITFVSDPALVDLNNTGSTELTLAHGKKQENVTLTVEDTTPPKVTFVDHITTRIDQIPTADAFVSEIFDESKTEVRFASDVFVPKDYSDLTVTVEVQDANGNVTRQNCVLSFIWMLDSFSLEFGEPLQAGDVLIDPSRDVSLVHTDDIDAVNAGDVGVYTVTSTVGDQSAVCQVTVSDTTAPILTLKTVKIRPGERVNLDRFLETVEDVSEITSVQMVSPMDFYPEGKHTISVQAEDIHGNVAVKETMLWVGHDFAPPTIFGAYETLTVAKHSDPDFLKGVHAYEKGTGNCEVTCDTSALDVHTAGTYYITYSAWDNAGNEAKVKRKVIVEHDAEDTAALVESIAAKLSNDPEELRDYVRSKIRYTKDWGGDDPVWFGFTNRYGNCYVHALCLQSLFDLKGIQSQLIWVTNKSHYWLLVKIDGVWKHIDPTPSTLHGRYSLMNDDQRQSTLSGRVWDRKAWPACGENYVYELIDSEHRTSYLYK